MYARPTNKVPKYTPRILGGGGVLRGRGCLLPGLQPPSDYPSTPPLPPSKHHNIPLTSTPPLEGGGVVSVWSCIQEGFPNLYISHIFVLHTILRVAFKSIQEISPKQLHRCSNAAAAADLLLLLSKQQPHRTAAAVLLLPLLEIHTKHMLPVAVLYVTWSYYARHLLS